MGRDFFAGATAEAWSVSAAFGTCSPELSVTHSTVGVTVRVGGLSSFAALTTNVSRRWTTPPVVRAKR